MRELIVAIRKGDTRGILYYVAYGKTEVAFRADADEIKRAIKNAVMNGYNVKLIHNNMEAVIEYQETNGNITRAEIDPSNDNVTEWADLARQEAQGRPWRIVTGHCATFWQRP